MTVAELIRALQNIDPEAPVHVHELCEVVDVEGLTCERSYVILETNCYCGYVL